MRTLTEERRQAFITAAAQLFQEIGYERASMNEVAKRVGGSKATLYNYFTSKEELFESVVRTYSAGFLADAAAELTKPGSEALSIEQKLTRFGERMLQVLTGDNQALQIYRVVVGEAGHSDIGILFRESGIRQSMETLAQVMDDAVQKEELIEGEPMLRAMQFTALVKAETDVLIYQRELPHFTPAQIRRMVENGVRLFLNGAAAKAGSKK
ncbi:TetR family transcriptional regulator [Brenneria goodwinii]|uniref:TetR family transcriptional regulator n=1 Tax=Brenneria goodwinii TaxID=1109412 RepID=A0AAE8JP79_9GAMM|nr:TetR/AcrR family transcriptional regulator [Brenneria goodwinii]ATA23766.1 TetR family transcriptional regulator [Brenneria goodwinii]RLM28512.1 TetR family transcriptional regulator [Brenneria goodwinii]